MKKFCRSKTTNILYLKSVLMIGVLCFSIQACATSPTRSVRVEVVGDDGVPIENAVLKVSFPGSTRSSNRSKVSPTDPYGIASVQGETAFRIAFSVTKAGFYSSRFVDNSKSELLEKRIILRKKRNPIPMFVKSVSLRFPVLKKKIGFDFTVGDWVSPHGKGVSSDIYLSGDVERNKYTSLTQTLKMSFPGDADGIHQVSRERAISESYYPYLYRAPESGYHPELSQILKVSKSGSRTIEGGADLSVLRVRSDIQENQIVSSQFVKIYPSFKLTGGFTDKPGVKFSYYLNQTKNDRNIEFDVNKNLYTNLRESEKVDQP